MKTDELVTVKREVLEQVLEVIEEIAQNTTDKWQDDAVIRAARPLHAALEQRAMVKPVRGWGLVPFEPTPEMLQAGRDAECTATAEDCAEDYRAVYKAMLAAAPQPAQQPAKERKPINLLTDDEVSQIAISLPPNVHIFAEAIELAVLKKNNLL